MLTARSEEIDRRPGAGNPGRRLPDQALQHARAAGPREGHAARVDLIRTGPAGHRSPDETQISTAAFRRSTVDHRGLTLDPSPR
jgi:hypothetical protein